MSKKREPDAMAEAQAALDRDQMTAVGDLLARRLSELDEAQLRVTQLRSQLRSAQTLAREARWRLSLARSAWERARQTVRPCERLDAASAN